jgi:hypothetical protein
MYKAILAAALMFVCPLVLAGAGTGYQLVRIEPTAVPALSPMGLVGLAAIVSVVAFRLLRNRR